MTDPDQLRSLVADAESLLVRVDAATVGKDGAGACGSALFAAAIKLDGAVVDLRRAAGDEPPPVLAALAALRARDAS